MRFAQSAPRKRCELFACLIELQGCSRICLAGTTGYPYSYRNEQAFIAENTVSHIDIQHLQQLRTYGKRHHAFPSMPELCEVAGLPSTASVCDLASRLKEGGHVERAKGRLAQTMRFFARPLVGQVRTGLSQSASDDRSYRRCPA
jgi:hypothetical protein